LDNPKRNVTLPAISRESNVFFINANGKLQNVSKQSGADILSNSRSVAYLDYDNDGDLDMIPNNYHEAAVRYRNNAELLKGNWLKIKLVGDPAQKTTAMRLAQESSSPPKPACKCGGKSMAV